MKRIGIIGGGQLGKMMILDGKRLDTWFIILDPTRHCPADSIADRHIVAGFDDIAAIHELAEQCDVVTYEFEHISVEALRSLEAEGHTVYPSAKTLAWIQNKLHQKERLAAHGLPVPDFIPIENFAALQAAPERFGYPVILKTCTGGYDGKGNAVIRGPEEMHAAYEALGAGRLPLMAEVCVPFTKEISVLACRNPAGETAVFPVAENVHRDSILDETTVPAAIADATAQEAMEVAERCLEVFGAVGMLCVELFVTPDGHVLVNELAPRPHNSGHYTIEACYTSQFEQHIRAVCGLPLGNPGLIRPAAMKNLIGTHAAGQAVLLGLAEAYQNPNVKIHLYGKETVSKGRKMGHLTAIADTVEEALRQVRTAHAALRFAKTEEEGRER